MNSYTTNDFYYQKVLLLFKDFCFRRISKINYMHNIPVNWIKMYMKKNGQLYKNTSYKKEPDDEVLVETPRCQRFHGFTSPQLLRNEGDNHPNESLYFSSQTECDLNEKGELVPVVSFRKGIPPRKEQLVCGIVSQLSEDRCRPFIKWFKCSEEFYKMLTILRKGVSYISSNKIFSNVRDKSFTYVD